MPNMWPTKLKSYFSHRRVHLPHFYMLMTCGTHIMVKESCQKCGTNQTNA